ncbi:DUF1631 family protein [Xenophilus aerolatus]|nr:DUF1631 family protein [Xenophilus aerolatus]
MSTASASESGHQLARETRERFVQATDAAIGSAAQAVRERLVALANETGTARVMQDHRDNLVAYRGAESGWVSLSRAQWRKAMGSAGISAEGASSSGSSLRLELVGDEVVENNILSSRLALAIQDKANFELNDLRLRIQFLEGSDELRAGDVLKPEVLAKLLVDQWLAAGMSRQLWAQVQSLLHAQLGEAAVTAYKEANAFLIAKGVMPEIDLKRLVRKPAGGPSGPAPLGAGYQPTAVASQPQAASWQGAGGSAAGIPPGMAGFAPAAIGVRPSGPLGAPGSLGQDTLVATGMSPFMAARQRAQGVMVSLRRFVGAVTGGVPAGAPLSSAPGGGGVAVPGGSPAFMAAIADAGAAYQVGSSAYMVGVDVGGDGATAVQRSAAELRRRSNELKRQAPTTADKATVEIVALMFQAILAEERIPFSARVWFARLQMPVLRVAIAEPEFFGTLQHPARMLIDRMGSVVMGFDAAAISGSALENEIRRVVQVIEQYPETGQRVFKLVYDEFVAFLNKYLTQGDATKKLMSVAQQVEQKETMAIQYTIELRKMLNDMPVREEIREFLFKVWAEVLALAALKYGGQDEQTVMLKRVASELVWAASAKPNRTDRARVIQELPKLLQRLRQGMELLGVTGAPQEEQIKTIGKTLSDAFMSKTAAISPAQIEAMASHLTNLEDFVGDGEGGAEMPMDAASIELLLGVDAASIEVVPNTGTKVTEDMLTWAHELQVGNWFMLDHNGRASQVQFVWRSERKHLHLFAAPDGRKFLIQAGRLASYLQAGLLVPAEEETLTARATREALAKLDANPERLLN